MHEKRRNREIKNTYQGNETWIRSTSSREEGFWREERFWVEIEVREIEIFGKMQN